MRFPSKRLAIRLYPAPKGRILCSMIRSGNTISSQKLFLAKAETNVYFIQRLVLNIDDGMLFIKDQLMISF